MARFFLDSEFSDNLSVQVVMERRNINSSMRVAEPNGLNVQLHPDGIVALAEFHPDVPNRPHSRNPFFGGSRRFVDFRDEMLANILPSPCFSSFADKSFEDAGAEPLSGMVRHDEVGYFRLAV